MADELLPGPDSREPDEIGLLPFDEDAENEDASRRVDPVAPDKFLYIGEGKNAEEFAAYVENYHFGSQPPDFVVLHHTANPCLRKAHLRGGADWDAGEDGLSEAQIKERRLRKLNGLKEYGSCRLRGGRAHHGP